MLLNRATVCALTGLSAGSLYRRMKAGLFPPQVIYRPLKIRGWRREDIDKWLGLRWELEPEAAVAAFARSGLPTARTTLHARYAAVRLTCRHCGCWRHADLQKLIDEGWGDVPLIHLRRTAGIVARAGSAWWWRRSTPDHGPQPRPVRKIVLRAE
jgi:predicted DNA-binding transcriptional regulator AlpA